MTAQVARIYPMTAGQAFADADRGKIVMSVTADATKVVLADDPTDDQIIGIVLDNAADDGTVRVATQGLVHRVKFGGVVAPNKNFTTSAAGLAVACTSGDIAVGRYVAALVDGVLESTASGRVYTVELFGHTDTITP